jgi:hypothetical protein
MKKKSISENENSAESDKSVFRQAGELIGTIGAQIANGTGKVVDFVSDEATIVKKAIKKKLAKKNTPKKKPVKKTPSTKTKKSSKKKSVKRATKRPVRKTRKS